jgi:tellurite resistance protein TehA-like permease
MAQTLDIAGAGTVGMAGNRAPFGLFKNLERPGDIFRDLGPNWFAAVMGTGIVANASAVLPLPVPGLRGFATVVWGLAAAMLVALTAAWAVHWTRYTERARAHASNPVMAQFWGAAAMALMTVGGGTLVLGRDVIGPAAVGIDWVLWLAGTALGLIPHVGSAFGGQGRLTLLLACPVGTCVTGTISLALRCHSDVLRGASVLLFGLLLAAWLVVASRTVAGVVSGRLFAPGAAISKALST